MVFSSISFLFFLLPLFLIADRLTWRSQTWVRNAVMLAVSLLFYVWGESTNVAILICMGLVNYVGGRFVGTFTPEQNKKIATQRKISLGILIALDLAVLFTFKYLAWLVGMVSDASIKISLPLGISFFTFHAISYVVDVYRGDVQPAKSLASFMTYFCMFPHLVAGPIVRYRHVESGLASRSFDADLFYFGLYRFLLGVNKKCLVANMVAPMADMAFSGLISASNTGDAWLGALAYTLQIYFDFSAYSDMAIGLAAMAGFKFYENFSRPYSATSMRDFWRRWHISLSSFLKDYLYIPLGGNRKGEKRTLINLVIVFFLCGLWHGANFTFIVWGLWHGFFLVTERLGLGNILETLPIPIKRLYAFVIIMVGWVFFRAEDLGQAMHYLGLMFNPAHLDAMGYMQFSASLIGVIIGVVICLLPDKLLPHPESHGSIAVPNAWLLVQFLLFFLSVAFLVSGARSPFIYFNF